MKEKRSLRELLGLRRRPSPAPTPQPKVKMQVPYMGDGPLDELYIAVVHQDEVNESILLWTFMQRGSDGVDYPALTPVLAKSEEAMQTMLAFIRSSCDIYAMPGANENISIRRYEAAEHVEWFRVGAEAR